MVRMMGSVAVRGLLKPGAMKADADEARRGRRREV